MCDAFSICHPFTTCRAFAICRLSPVAAMLPDGHLFNARALKVFVDSEHLDNQAHETNQNQTRITQRT